ncbi:MULTISPECIES: type III secretion HpaP family protein [Pandoraea]|uniref:type III secretion HpaP family protein n=1 Tax=Pandoraea TaxID=93217 RepID=UPI001F5CCF06|nr:MULTISPECIES: type III secretion HpaP family protein [Pandoraea]MCI3208276.1 hypothetical protein [Pandoraea sp. LA3]MDN4586305.1 hypothetical protein [Pandoraea capi]
MNHRIRLQGAILHAPATDEATTTELPRPRSAADGEAAGRFRQLLMRRGPTPDDTGTPDGIASEDEKPHGGEDERPPGGQSDDALTGITPDGALPWQQNDARERMMATADASPGTARTPHHRPHPQRTQPRRTGVSGASATQAPAAQDAEQPDEAMPPARIEGPISVSAMPADRQRFGDSRVPQRLDDTTSTVEAANAAQRFNAFGLPAIVDALTQALTAHRTTSAQAMTQRTDPVSTPREIVLTLNPAILPDTRVQLQLSGGALSLRFETEHRQSVALLSDQAAQLAQRVFHRTGRAVTVSLNGDTLVSSHRSAS